MLLPLARGPGEAWQAGGCDQERQRSEPKGQGADGGDASDEERAAGVANLPAKLGRNHGPAHPLRRCGVGQMGKGQGCRSATPAPMAAAEMNNVTVPGARAMIATPPAVSRRPAVIPWVSLTRC